MKLGGVYTSADFDGLAAILKKAGVDLSGVPEYVRAAATDIHIAVGQPIVLYCFGLNRYTVPTMICRREMDELFFRLCELSVYKHSEEIKNGFITVGGKYRCGICGTCVSRGGEAVSVRNVTALNLRVPHTVPGIAGELVSRRERLLEGVLLIGEPSSGKTTLLKDLIDQLAGERVTVIDERYELGGASGADILLGYNKSLGIAQAIRTLSPRFILCDELDHDDIEAVRMAVSTGVSVIASVHGKPEKNKPLRPVIRELIETGAFATVAVLRGRLHPGIIEKIYEAGEFCEAFGGAPAPHGRISLGNERKRKAEEPNGAADSAQAAAGFPPLRDPLHLRSLG